MYVCEGDTEIVSMISINKPKIIITFNIIFDNIYTLIFAYYIIMLPNCTRLHVMLNLVCLFSKFSFNFPSLL